MITALREAGLPLAGPALRALADTLEEGVGARVAAAWVAYARAGRAAAGAEMASWWAARLERAERAKADCPVWAAGALRALAHELEAPTTELEVPEEAAPSGSTEQWDSIVPGSVRWAFAGAESVEWVSTSRMGDEWRVAGLGQASAGAWAAWGFEVNEAVAWRCVTVHDPDEAAEWRAFGFRPPSAVAWRDAGFAAGAARAAAEAGFDHELATATREDAALRGVVADLLGAVRGMGAAPVPQRTDGLRAAAGLVLERYRRAGRRAEAIAGLHRLVGVLCARGRSEEAAEVLEGVPERPRVLKARVALASRDLERAWALLRSATGPEAELLRGVAALREGNVETALQALRAAQHGAEQAHDMRVFALARCHLGLALEHPNARRFSGAVEAATLALEDGLRLLDVGEAPIDVGVARTALARLCLRRRDGEVRARREAAVDHLHASLAALTTANAREERGRAHLMLGTVLQKLSEAGRGEALAEAVAHLRASLRFLREPRAREEAQRVLDAARSEME